MTIDELTDLIFNTSFNRDGLRRLLKKEFDARYSLEEVDAFMKMEYLGSMTFEEFIKQYRNRNL